MKERTNGDILKTIIPGAKGAIWNVVQPTNH